MLSVPQICQDLGIVQGTPLVKVETWVKLEPSEYKIYEIDLPGWHGLLLVNPKEHQHIPTHKA